MPVPNAKSGHENITITKAGNYWVVVAGINLGTFHKIAKALSARDEFRAKRNMKPART